MDRVLRAAVGSGALPFVAASVVDRAGVRYHGVHGPLEAAAAFRIGSMTAPLTAVACLQLVAEGVVALDDPVANRIPSFADAQVLDEFGERGRPVTRPARVPITLRHLLSHTSGMAFGTWDHAIVAIEAAGGPTARAGLDEPRLRAPLVFDPGTKSAYGPGVDWAGRLVEVVSGEPLDRVLGRRILGPLGMATTGFLPTTGVLERLAPVHRRTPVGALVPIDVPATTGTDAILGGEGMYSTLSDYGRFVRMILGGGTLDGAEILDSRSIESLRGADRPRLPFRRMDSTDPARSGLYEPFGSAPASWGLSFLVNDAPVPGGRSAGSLAWAGILNTSFWIDPAAGIGGVFLTQVTPFADRDVLDVAAEFERAVYAAL